MSDSVPENFQAGSFLETLRFGHDAVIKGGPQLPIVSRGSDIDIFSNLPQELISRLTENALNLGMEVKSRSLSSTHFHLDVFDREDFLVKFDIYGAPPSYSRLEVKNRFLWELISESKKRTISGFEFPVPSKIHEALIRYFEYLDFFWNGPDKVRHLDWILDSLNQKERDEMLTLAHTYATTKENFYENRSGNGNFSWWQKVALTLANVRLFSKIARWGLAPFPRTKKFLENTLFG